jgi:chromosomal replication initiator protein
MIVICPCCNNVFDYTPPTNELKIDTVKMYDIADICCEYFKVTRTDLFSQYRGKDVNKARQVAMYFIYGEERNGISLEEVGEFFNRKDHSTVINARNRCKDAIETRMDIYKDLLILSPKAEEIISKNNLKVAI